MSLSYRLKTLLLPAVMLVSHENSSAKIVNDFSLKNIDGKYLSLKDYPNAKGFIIVFTCNHCPFAKLYPPRLNALNEKYGKLGVPLLAISSTDTVVYEEDSYPEMVKKATREQFNFPYLFDELQNVAKDFAAQKTPHAYVIWNEGGKWIVKYNGAIDDNGADPDKVKNKYVADAVDALLQGRAPVVKETKSIGCQVNFRK